MGESHRATRTNFILKKMYKDKKTNLIVKIKNEIIYIFQERKYKKYFKSKMSILEIFNRLQYINKNHNK